MADILALSTAVLDGTQSPDDIGPSSPAWRYCLNPTPTHTTTLTVSIGTQQASALRKIAAKLWIVSQSDIGASLEVAQTTLPYLQRAGVQRAWVPGFPHFYPSGAVSLGDDGTRLSVGERITQFLGEHLKN